jgi:hypothetical protein
MLPFKTLTDVPTSGVAAVVPAPAMAAIQLR